MKNRVIVIIGSIALLAMATLIALEAFDFIDWIDQDEIVCANGVPEMVVKPVPEPVPDTHYVEVVREVFRDTGSVREVLKEVERIMEVRDTVRDTVLLPIKVFVDTIDFKDAQLRYLAMTEGNLLGFFPELEVHKSEAVQEKRFIQGVGVGGGMMRTTDDYRVVMDMVLIRNRWKLGAFTDFRDHYGATLGVMFR